MKILTMTAVAVLALGMSACGANGGGQFADFAKQVVTDPKCGHDDTVLGSIGGVTGGSLQVSLARHCPQPQAPLQTGQTVAPTSPTASTQPPSASSSPPLT